MKYKHKTKTTTPQKKKRRKPHRVINNDTTFDSNRV